MRITEVKVWLVEGIVYNWTLLEGAICDIIMPDITRCGGPSELKRMATMAET
jgi:L-alanine-DL-glutamate epimerase-like enolase superfamily enzyme